MTLRVHVDLKDAKGLLKASSKMELALKLALWQAGSIVQRAVIERTPVNLATLKASIANGLKVFMGVDPRAEVATGLEYAEAVEKGRKKGKFPPKDPIEMWVRHQLHPKEEDVEELVFLIRRAIALGTTKGHSLGLISGSATKGFHMFERGLEASRGDIESLFHAFESQLTAELEKGKG